MDIHKMLESELFEGISEEELTEMIYSNPNSIKQYSKGDIIAHQGDEVKGLMILTEGVVNNLLGEGGKKQVIVKTLHAPTFLLPAIIFASDPRFPTTIQAAVDSEVVLITRDRLIRYAKRNNRLMQNVVRVISDRFQFLAVRLRLNWRNTWAWRDLRFRVRCQNFRKKERYDSIYNYNVECRMENYDNLSRTCP